MRALRRGAGRTSPGPDERGHRAAGNDVRERTHMNVDAWLRAIAGTFILLSLILGYAVSPWFYLFTAFVGLNLLQSGFSGWCPMMSILRRMGVRG